MKGPDAWSKTSGDPSRRGQLDLGDGQVMAWLERGAANGLPVLLLHGGPGSGISATQAKLFDPATWRIVQFDQRGCGESRPHASEPAFDLSRVTTQGLVADIERLREELGISRWVVFGASWGSTLALAYAARHADRVTGLLLAGVTTTSRQELDWLYGHAGLLFPQAFSAFAGPLVDTVTPKARIAALAKRLADPDPQCHGPAADRWCDWELTLACSDPRARRSDKWDDPAFRLAFARLTSHIFAHEAWLAPGELLTGLAQLERIPVRLVHARFDLCAPFDTAWRVSLALPSATLDVVDGAVHSATDDGMFEAVRTAVANLAGRIVA